MKTLKESIFEVDPDKSNKMLKDQQELIEGLAARSGELYQNSSYSHSGYDVFGEKLKVGDAVLYVNYYENCMGVAMIIKMDGSELVLSDDPDDVGNYEIINGEKYRVVDSYQVIKIKDPKKFVRTGKLF